MQGMSGSPVYIDGKLVGAVALAFAYAKEPIAGIRPIEDMIRPVATRAAIAAPRAPIAMAVDDLVRALPQPTLAMAGSAQMVDIATPLSFGGFTRATLDTFAPQLRALGLEPRQAVSSAGKLSDAMGNPADLKPGSMISVQLLSGDYNVGRRWHGHLHRRQSHLCLRPSFSRRGRHLAPFRPLGSTDPGAQHQHFVQTFCR